jgi:hypothetical protein
MKVFGRILLCVSLFLLLWSVEASAAWINVPYYASYPYVAPHAYAPVTVSVSYNPYAYYAPVYAAAPVYAPAPVYVPAVTYVSRPVVYAPAIPVYNYPQMGLPWTYWTY